MGWMDSLTNIHGAVGILESTLPSLGRALSQLLKNMVELLDAAESTIKSYLRTGHFSCLQMLAGVVDPHFMDESQNSLPSYDPENAHEITLGSRCSLGYIIQGDSFGKVVPDE